MLVPGVSATAGTLDPSDGPAHHVGSEPTDLTDITWLDAETGLPTDAPAGLESSTQGSGSLLLPGGLPSLGGGGLITPFTSNVATCSSGDYKVIITQVAQAGTVSECFRGVGTASYSNSVMASVVGVCPGSNKGQIYYQANGNWHWSTLRGPYASNSTCFNFASSGVYPSKFSKVYLNAPS